MNAHAYSEDQLVEKPAIGLFAELGWQTVSALEESFGSGGTLGRETKGEVEMLNRLRAALCKFNQTLPPEAIQTAIDKLTRDRSAMSLEAANREVYRLLKEGVTVSVAELKQRLDVLTSTDMAVIVSPGQNEIQQMQTLGLDIKPRRKRMNESNPGLDEKFKETDDPLRLVFVCAMWLTSFDAPSCSTVYLDKPMHNE